MKAITIQQPWAWAIAAGHKLVENRTWPTNYRGPLAIHASKSPKTYRQHTRDFPNAWTPDGEFGIHLPPRSGLHFGHLVAVVDLVDCVRIESGDGRLAAPWAAGPWCFILANPRPIATPIPLSGKLGIFPLDASTVARLA